MFFGRDADEDQRCCDREEGSCAPGKERHRVWEGKVLFEVLCF